MGCLRQDGVPRLRSGCLHLIASASMNQWESHIVGVRELGSSECTEGFVSARF